jgi:hypothetical protein
MVAIRKSTPTLYWLNFPLRESTVRNGYRESDRFPLAIDLEKEG